MKTKQIVIISIFFIMLSICISPSSLTQEQYKQNIETTGAIGLIGLWGFNEGNANDESGNEYHGYSNGVEFIDGIFGLGCEIEGTERISSISNTFDDNINNQITISVWIYPYEGYVNKNCYIFDNREYTLDGGGIILSILQDNKVRLNLPEVGDDQFVTSSTSIPIQTWTHIAGVFNHDSGIMKMYINGVENNVSSTFKSYKQSRYSACIGNNHWADGQWRPLNGIIDEVRVYNRALDDDEIENLYENPSGFHKAFIIGKISDISSTAGIITFESVNVHYFKTNPFTHKRYFLGETIRITDDYKGYLSGAFVIASVNIDI